MLSDRPLLLICDLDRTLIPNGDAEERPGARERFTAFVGHPAVTLAYASGRDPARIRGAIDTWCLPHPDFVIADVGARLFDLRDRWLRADWSEDPVWHDTLAADWPNVDWPDIARLLAHEASLMLQESDRQSRFKCSFYTHDHVNSETVRAEVVRALWDQRLRSRTVFSVDTERGLGLLDVLPRSASKLGAVRALQSRLGLSDPDTVFAGDSGNDLDVLTSSVPSVLVHNASDTVRATAKRDRPGAGLYCAASDDGPYADSVLAGVRHHRSGQVGTP